MHMSKYIHLWLINWIENPLIDILFSGPGIIFLSNRGIVHVCRFKSDPASTKSISNNILKRSELKYVVKDAANNGIGITKSTYCLSQQTER